MTEVIALAIDSREGVFVVYRHLDLMTNEELILVELVKIVGGTAYWWEQGAISSGQKKKKKKLRRTNLSAAQKRGWFS